MARPRSALSSASAYFLTSGPSGIHEFYVERTFLIVLSRSQSRVSGYEVSYLDQTPWFLGIYVLSREGTAVANRARANRVVVRELGLTYCNAPFASAASLSLGFSTQALAETNDTLS